MDNYTYEAGVWEQYQQGRDGDGLVVWSRHHTRDAALRAAKRYARSRRSRTGGALSWAGGYRPVDAGVRVLTRAGPGATTGT